jgi:hypothetical protein
MWTYARWSRLFPLLATLGLTVCASAQARVPEGEDELAAGHARMLLALQEVHVQATRVSRFLGTEHRDELAARLEALEADAPPQDRAQLLHELSVQELRQGAERQAIEHLEQALELVRDVPPDLQRPREVESRYQLALAYLRLGETENCCLRHHADSCLLPIQGGGLHQKPEGSSRASEQLLAVLEAEAGTDSKLERGARWLLNIAAMTLDGYPDDVPAAHRIPPERFESEEPFPRLANVAIALGVDAFNLAGGGVVDDLDGDGNLDIAQSSMDTQEPVRVFWNEGDGRFTESVEEAGLAGIWGGLNMNHADADGDGHIDLFVLRGGWLGSEGQHPNSLLHNNGDRTFTDVSYHAGVAGQGQDHPTQTAAWADYDNDGQLDLYVGNEHSLKLDAPGQLFRNNGDGTFAEVARAAGVTNRRFAKGTAWGDTDDDGWPDLYVSNLGRNRLYRNRGDGGFDDVAAALGVQRPRQSFPVWFWDFDNDGVLDLYVSSYDGKVAEVEASRRGAPQSWETDHLYRGDGQGGFEQVAEARDIRTLHLTMGANFGDIDSDGFLDMYLGTGYPENDGLIPNVLYRNRDGESFADVTTAAGMGHLQKGHGVAFADIDNDGDQDVFEQLGGAYPGDAYSNALFENPGNGNGWITLQLVGTESNRGAIGARLALTLREGDRTRVVYKFVNTGSSFGGNPLRQTVGLGAAESVERLEVRWPAGTTEVFEDVPSERCFRIVEGAGALEPLELVRFRLGG